MTAATGKRIILARDRTVVADAFHAVFKQSQFKVRGLHVDNGDGIFSEPLSRFLEQFHRTLKLSRSTEADPMTVGSWNREAP